MIWIITASYISDMPKDFESLTAKDAEGIMQAWADTKRTHSDRPEFGKLGFNWSKWNESVDVCTAAFHRNGKQLCFMKIVKAEGESNG